MHWDGNGVGTTNTFDPLGRILKTSGQGWSEGYGYTSGIRQMTSLTNAVGNVTLFGYDEAGRRTHEIQVGVSTNLFEYNPAGDLLRLEDGRGKETIWEYDLYGRVVEKWHHGEQNADLVYSYNANGWLTNRLTRTGTGTNTTHFNTAYSYNANGNLTKVDYPAGTTDIDYTYDALNRMTSMVDAAGTTTWSYSLPGNGVFITAEDGPWSNDTVTVTNIHGLRSALVIQQPVSTWTTTYAHDTSRRLTGVTGGGQTWSYDHTTATGAALASVAAGSLISKVTLPGSHRIDNTFNSLGLLTDSSLKTSGGTLRNQHGYVHDAAHRRTTGSRTNSVATGWNGRFDYTYDSVGQLQTAWAYNSAGTQLTSQKWGYAYDPGQNLLRQTNNATTTTFTANDLNQMTAFPSHTQTFDRPGNLTQRSSSGSQQRYFVYDHEHQLIEVRSDTYYTPESSRFKEEYVYDGRGRLRERKTWTHYLGSWAASTTYRYLYDGMLIVQERTPSTPSVTYTRGVDLSGSLSGAGGIGGLLGRSTGYNGGTGAWSTHTSYHADGNGNVTAILDTSGNLTASYHYNPWGALLGITGSHSSANTMRHSSKPWFGWRGSSTAGLTYFGYRFYDPTTMRWVNRDPIGEEGGLNLYQFVKNSPMNLFDPLGLQSNVISIPGMIASGWSARDIALVAGISVAAAEAMIAAHIAKEAAKCKPKKPKKDECKWLTPKEIKKLKNAGHDPHKLKEGLGAGFDLCKDKDGNIHIKPKDGSGPGDPTGININNL
jgi:RHS repeat-associated protein